MLIIDCKEFPTIQAFLDHALLKQQAILDGEDQAKLQSLKDAHESKEIMQEFKRSQTCHDFYRPFKVAVIARKPNRSKPIITTKDEVFFYYLTSKQKLANKFYRLSKAKQKAVRNIFSNLSIDSSAQAIAVITNIIK